MSPSEILGLFTVPIAALWILYTVSTWSDK